MANGLRCQRLQRHMPLGPNTQLCGPKSEREWREGSGSWSRSGRRSKSRSRVRSGTRSRSRSRSCSWSCCWSRSLPLAFIKRKFMPLLKCQILQMSNAEADPGLARWVPPDNPRAPVPQLPASYCCCCCCCGNTVNAACLCPAQSPSPSPSLSLSQFSFSSSSDSVRFQHVPFAIAFAIAIAMCHVCWDCCCARHQFLHRAASFGFGPIYPPPFPLLLCSRRFLCPVRFVIKRRTWLLCLVVVQGKQMSGMTTYTAQNGEVHKVKLILNNISKSFSIFKYII